MFTFRANKNKQTNKQTKPDKKSRMKEEKLQNLHLASQIGGNSVIGNAEINVLIHKHRRWQQV